VTRVDQLLARILALHPADRQWLLANASAETRARLVAALESGPTEWNAPAPCAEEPGSDRQVIGGAQPEAVVWALRTEPSWMVAAVLQLQQWPWTAAVLERLPASRRPRLATALPGSLAEALVKRLAQRLREFPESAQTPARTVSAFEELLQRVRGRRGEVRS
jgi:hypothetical protein